MKNLTEIEKEVLIQIINKEKSRLMVLNRTTNGTHNSEYLSTIQEEILLMQKFINSVK